MNIITKPYVQAASILSALLREQVALGPVLLLLSGGSATGVYQELSTSLDLDLQPGQLVVGLVDERYDLNPEHPDSNALLIKSSGLITRIEQLGGIFCPILHGHPMAEESAQYAYQLTQFAQHENRAIIAILGFGTDGHTAGILPDNNVEQFTQHFDSANLAVGYTNSGQFPQRITVTLPLLRMAHTAIVLAKDTSKLPIIKRATNRSYPEPLHLLPATIIQEIENVIIATPSEEEV